MSETNLLWVKQDSLPVAGVELGGTRCVCALAFAPDRIIAQETVPTEDPEVTLPALQAILKRWHNDTGFSALGIASFGPVCLNEALPAYGCILSTNKPGWSNVDVLGILSSGLNVPVGFDTDVNGVKKQIKQKALNKTILGMGFFRFSQTRPMCSLSQQPNLSS